jgi:hypothetical protein
MPLIDVVKSYCIILTTIGSQQQQNRRGEIRRNNYCSLSMTTQTQQQKNGRGERIESSYVLLITYKHNNNKKRKVIKSLF